MPFPDLVTVNAGWGTSNRVDNTGSVGSFADGDNNRWMILMDPVLFVLQAYKTTDNGVTWSREDSGNEPAVKADDARTWQYYSVTRDANPLISKLYVVYWATDSTVRLGVFDMGAGVWGAQIAGVLTRTEPDQGGALYDLGFGIAHRAVDDTVWVMFQSGWTGVGADPSQIILGAKCAITGAGWDAAVTSFGPVLDVTQSWGPVGMVTDSLGNIHCIYHCILTAAGPLPALVLAHQAIHPDNSLSVMDAIVAPYNGLTSVSYPTIAAVTGGDEIVFKFTVSDDISLGFNVGTVRGIAGDAPVWEILAPVGSGNIQGSFETGATNVGGVDYLFFSYLDLILPATINYAFVTSTGIGDPWGAVETIVGQFDLTAPNPPGSSVGSRFYMVEVPQPGGVLAWALSIGYGFTATTDSGMGYWELFSAPPIPVVVVYPQTGGGKTPRKCGNFYDECAGGWADYFGVLDWKGVLLCIPRCYRSPEPNCDIPLTGQQFRRQGAIDLPLNDGSDQLIFEWSVPEGYFAVVTDHTQLYTESGFTEAGVDLIWRIRIDQWWVKDMGNMNTSRGNLNHLFPIPDYILMQPNQTLRYYANVPGDSRLSGGKVIAGINGWFYSTDEIPPNRLQFDERKLSRYWRSNRGRERLTNKERHG